MSEFKGVKKRLEKVFSNERVCIIDDFAPSPNRVQTSLNILRKEYPNYEITIVFEPNSGSRINGKDKIKEIYNKVFSKANEIIIPDLSSFNKALLTSEELVGFLSNSNEKVRHIKNEDICFYLEEKTSKDKNKKHLLVFYSSYRLESIMSELISTLQT